MLEEGSQAFGPDHPAVVWQKCSTENKAKKHTCHKDRKILKLGQACINKTKYQTVKIKLELTLKDCTVSPLL